MEKVLENLSKEDLLKVISSQRKALDAKDETIKSLSQYTSKKDQQLNALSSANVELIQECDYLKAQVEMLKRMQFGQKRERF